MNRTKWRLKGFIKKGEIKTKNVISRTKEGLIRGLKDSPTKGQMTQGQKTKGQTTQGQTTQGQTTRGQKRDKGSSAAARCRLRGQVPRLGRLGGRALRPQVLKPAVKPRASMRD